MSLKKVELKVLSELMKNSKQSDRELAKIIGVSQPTVTRTRARLEKEGVIQEYTAIPDFAKLGYEILAITFVKLRKVLSPAELDKARKDSVETMKTAPKEIILLERGVGLGSDWTFITLHKTYASYLKFREWLTHFSFLEMTGIESFLVSLKDKIRYKPLTFKTLADHILELENKEKE
jgi:DNA-binding Lrp family transcriptional regulator